MALTFDDGPSRKQTPEILSILERLGVRVTFFEEGRHVRGREALMRRALADGDEIGNHSFHHPHYPGSRELAATDRRIRRATGFRPCLFRPPYGLLDRRVREAASDNGLETILWTFDSGDDHHPTPARIEAHVVSAARPGSIILMHDGGHHPQTIEALPGLIAGLRRRGYCFATVSALLGDHFTYAPSSSGDPGTRTPRRARVFDKGNTRCRSVRGGVGWPLRIRPTGRLRARRRREPDSRRRAVSRSR